MKNLQKSLLAQVFAVGLLGMGLTACNNADNAPETEEPVESTSVGTENTTDTMATDSNMGATGEEHDMNNMEDQGMGADTTVQDQDMAKPESDLTKLDPNAPATEGDINTDTLDQDNVIDGTETEEHVSTN